MKIYKNHSGFTLIELVMVIVIIGILAAVALPKFTTLGSDARLGVMKSVQGSMQSANAMIFSRAAATGAIGPNGTVTNNGVPIAVAYGYAASVTDLVLAMDLIPATDFDVGASAINHKNAVTPADCSIIYTAAKVTGAVTTAPTYALTSTGC